MKQWLSGILGIVGIILVVVLIAFNYIDQHWGPSGVLVAALAMGMVMFMVAILLGGVAYSFGIARVMAYMFGTGLANMGRAGAADAAYYRYQSQLERNRMIADKQSAAQPVFSQPGRQWSGDVEDGEWVDSAPSMSNGTNDGWVLS